jgi:hypothetical protein
MDVADLCTTRPSPIRWTDNHAPTKRQEAASEAAPRPSKPGNRARGGQRRLQLAGPAYPKSASSARLVNTLPPNAGGRSGPPDHAEGEAPTQLALLPSTDDEHP